MNTFAKAFKKYMIENEISQNEIAEKCNLTKQAISNLFNRNNISLDKMLMLANAAGCKIDFVFNKSDDPDQN